MKLQQMEPLVGEPVGRTHIAEAEFGVSAFAYASLDDKRVSSAYDRITTLELDSYRIALIPREGLQRDSSRTQSHASSRSEFLLLPLTWRELVTQVRREMGHSH